MRLRQGRERRRGSTCHTTKDNMDNIKFKANMAHFDVSLTAYEESKELYDSLKRAQNVLREDGSIPTSFFAT